MPTYKESAQTARTLLAQELVSHPHALTKSCERGGDRPKYYADHFSGIHIKLALRIDPGTTFLLMLPSFSFIDKDLAPDRLANLKLYKYNAIDRSFFSRYLLRHYWDWAHQWFPSSMA